MVYYLIISNKNIFSTCFTGIPEQHQLVNKYRVWKTVNKHLAKHRARG